ncbi:MAG: D-alanine--D-alanine ligase [Actinomycetota bacterium]|nr:D-alanine--D-alanine ligase [Actinomycetota bacterium]
MSKSTVGVVFGGRSVEHDVSIVTAHQVMAVLSEDHDVVPIYVTREGRWLSSPGLNDLDVYKKRRWDEVGEEATLSPSPGVGLMVGGGRLRGPRRIGLDVVVPAIHGTYGEDGTLQGLLELADIPYVGSGVVASAVGMDKVAMKAVFQAAGLATVPDVLVETARLDVDPDALLDEIEARIGYPAFVKPTRLGSSVGIGKARDRDALVEALEVARRYDHRLLVERSMEGCIEINCSVVGGAEHEPEPSVCEQPVAWQEFLTFEDKYLRSSKGGGASKGSDQEPAGMASLDRRIPAPISESLTKQIQDNAVRAFRAVGASGVARIDAFADEESGEAWVMEINTVPGSFSFYLWEPSGVSFRDLMARLIAIAHAEHRAKSELMFSFDSAMLDRTGGSKTGG